MKLECQSCLLQFDAVGAGPDTRCPRCGSTNVTAAAGAPAMQTGPASGQAAIAATIAQPMMPPAGAPAAFNPVGAPAGGAPFGGAPPSGSPFGGAPPGASPYGSAANAPPPGAPYGGAPSPYGAPPAGGFGAPPSPYGAPQPAPSPYGAPQPAPSAYGAPASPYSAPTAPVGNPFGHAGASFGAAPMGMVAVTPYGNAQVDAEQRKAMVWAVVALLLFWPAAVGAWIQYNASMTASRMGDYGTALAKAKSAQMWGIVSTAIIAGFVVLGCLGGLLGAAAGG